MKRKSLNFPTKIILFNIVLISFLTFGLLAYFYLFVADTERSKAVSNMEILSTKAGEQLDDFFANMDKAALHLSTNPTVISTFASIPDAPGNFFETGHISSRELNDTICSYIFEDYSISRICLYNDQQDFIYTGTLNTSTDRIQSFVNSSRSVSIRDALRQNHGKLFMGPENAPLLNVTNASDPSDNLTFSVIREIKDYNSFEHVSYGYVEIQQSAKKVESLLNFSDPAIHCYLLDRNSGSDIYPFSEEEKEADERMTLCRNVLEKYPASSDAVYTGLSSDVLAGSYNLRELDGLTLVVLQDRADALRPLNSFITLVVCVLILIVFAVCSLQIFVIRHMTKPLIQIRESMKTVNIDHMEMELIPSDSSNELEVLRHTFNGMLAKLNQSFQELVLAHTNELEASLLALQAQVNPHFIHNTLALIQSASEENDPEKVAMICADMSSMLRFTTSYQSTSCTLWEELEYSESYLRLMKSRYEDLFSYSIEKCEALKDTIVPKLILHPILENCFTHGFKQKNPPWRIEIKVYEDNGWRIRISDNGIGFTSDFIENIQKAVSGTSAEMAAQEIKRLQIGGLGYKNTLLRLKIMYHENMVLTLSDSPGGGAVIIMGGTI